MWLWVIFWHWNIIGQIWKRQRKGNRERLPYRGIKHLERKRQQCLTLSLLITERIGHRVSWNVKGDDWRGSRVTINLWRLYFRLRLRLGLCHVDFQQNGNSQSLKTTALSSFYLSCEGGDTYMRTAFWFYFIITCSLFFLDHFHSLLSWLNFLTQVFYFQNVTL